MPKFTTPQLSWLTTLGKEADIVLASRVRLARNLKNLPFPNRANINDLAQIKRINHSLNSSHRKCYRSKI